MVYRIIPVKHKQATRCMPHPDADWRATLCRPGKHATGYSTCECSGSTCEYTDSNTQVACDEGFTLQVLMLLFLSPTPKDAFQEYGVQEHHCLAFDCIAHALLVAV